MRVFDEAAADYDSVGVEFFAPMGRALAEAAGIRPGDRVLDVGTGRGAVLFPAAALAGPDGHVTGIDSAPGMVARTAADADGLAGIEVAIGDAQRPGFPAGSFDVVTAGLLLFFLPDPAAALWAYHQLLRPGGTLAVSSFAELDPRHREAMKIVARHAVDPPPPPAYAAMFQDADRLRAAVGDAGFSGTRIERFPVRSEFRDAAHFLRWVGSHAGRDLVQRVPPEHREALIADLTPVLGARPGITTTIFLVTARRAG